MVRNLKSKDFTTHEVIHRNPENLPEELEPVAYHVHGFLQGFRNYLCVKHKKKVRLICTSGNRSPAYNATLPGASPTSYHQWRIDENDYIVWAEDVWSPDLTQDELYEDAAEFFNGEVYKHGHKKLVHVSDYGLNEDLGSLF